MSLGVDELDSGAEPLGRARQPGEGRKRAADLDPGLRPALLALVEPQERGDPMSPLRWTAKSTRNLADELTRQGHKVSADTVGDLLRAAGFSLQGNAKTIEGRRHPDRDAQFRYISEQRSRTIRAPGTRWSAWIPRKRSLSGSSPTRAGSGAPRASPRPPARMNFPGEQRRQGHPLRGP